MGDLSYLFMCASAKEDLWNLSSAIFLFILHAILG